ncbi:hypothetical protein GGI1_23541, partial [Acidithiobacillus sp. GGI-221]
MLRRMVVRLRKQSGMRVKELATVSGAVPSKGRWSRIRKRFVSGWSRTIAAYAPRLL